MHLNLKKKLIPGLELANKNIEVVIATLSLTHTHKEGRDMEDKQCCPTDFPVTMEMSDNYRIRMRAMSHKWPVST